MLLLAQKATTYMRLFLHFDENVDASMRAAAAKIATESAFEPASTPFHVCVLGSLHVYSREAVAAATQSFPTQLRARFAKWELRAGQLRAAVEIDGIIESVRELHKVLPRARPWSTYYVSIGSVAAIESARHDEFLAAVQAAFPLDPEMIFTLGRIDLHDEPPPQHTTTAAPRKSKPKMSKLDPKAPAVRQPAGGVKKQRKRKPRASPHMKWERTDTGTSADLIKSATASTGSRAVHARHAAAGRAAKIQAARQVWLAPRE